MDDVLYIEEKSKKLEYNDLLNFMKALVTGGQGFIGSHIVECLLKKNFTVVSIDDESAKNNHAFFKFNGAEYVNADILSEDTHRYYKNVDLVFHCAAKARIQPSLKNPALYFSTNVLGTQSVLEASLKAGVKKIIYSGSSSFYGFNQIPHKETMQSDCLNPYSLSKFQGEQLCKLYSKILGLSTIVLRYFNVYGPREPTVGKYATVIGIFKKQKQLGEKLTIVGDGTQRRDFTYIDDVVNANFVAAMSDVYHDVFNVGTGKNYSINQVASLIGGKTTNIPQRPAETKETLADITKTISTLNWRPEFDLEKIINEY